MNDILREAQEWITGPRLWDIVRAVSILLVGFVVSRVAAAALVRALSRVQTAQQMALTRRITAWVVLSIALMMAINELGFDITALLGAAGVLTVAIGFASQTTASNMISGLFLSSERGFELGAVIRVGTTLGEIISIDLLSVKLRTFDNLLVRIPNETLIKSEITTLNHFPIRRVDIAIGGAYHDELERIEEVLERVAEVNPLCLEDPKPLFMVNGFGDNAVTLQFSVWTQRDNFLEMRTSLLRQIKKAFEEEGLTFPFPQRQIHVDGGALVAAEPPKSRERASA